MNSKLFEIRKFQPEDAEACFRIRAEAFIKIFYDEIGPNGVAAGINAYMPSKYALMGEKMPIFVAVNNQEQIGFITLRFNDDSTIEILFLYIRFDCIGRGVGSELVRVAEDWVRKHHPEIGLMVVDTAVPSYNQKFYEKIGYKKIGESQCQYPDGPVRAVRLMKELR